MKKSQHSSLATMSLTDMLMGYMWLYYYLQAKYEIIHASYSHNTLRDTSIDNIMVSIQLDNVDKCRLLKIR